MWVFWTFVVLMFVVFVLTAWLKAGAPRGARDKVEPLLDLATIVEVELDFLAPVAAKTLVKKRLPLAWQILLAKVAMETATSHALARRRRR